MGFSFALSSTGWIFFAHLPAFGFLMCGGRQFWWSMGCPVGRGGEAAAAMPPCQGRGTGSEQLAETWHADQRSEQCHWFGLDWRKTNRLPPEFWCVSEKELRVP